jgi:hypothetical protein
MALMGTILWPSTTPDCGRCRHIRAHILTSLDVELVSRAARYATAEGREFPFSPLYVKYKMVRDQFPLFILDCPFLTGHFHFLIGWIEHFCEVELTALRPDDEDFR